MRTYRARLLCVGLGAFMLPACLEMGVRLVPEPPAETPPVATVKQVAPDATQVAKVQPGQQQIPQNVLVQQLPMPPVQGPNGEILVPVQIVNANGTPMNIPVPNSVQVVQRAQAIAPPPAQPVTSEPAPAQEDPSAMVAIMHTPEPPLASYAMPAMAMNKPAESMTNGQSPRMLPQVVQDAMRQTGTPAIVTAQTFPGEAKQAAYETTETPNMFAAPAQVEELKLVTPTAPKCDNTNLAMTIKSLQQRAEQANPAEVSEIVDQLQQVITTLRSKAMLRIEKLCYCRPTAKPAKLGVFQPLPDDHAFHCGESVELYMELRNFSCEAKDQEFKTHLTTRLEVCDVRGTVVSQFEFERNSSDSGSSPRHDYFHICRFPVQNLPAGLYTLNVKITDVPTGRVVEKTLPLVVDAVRTKTIVARGSAE